MQQVQKSVYRGDTRDNATMTRTNGFIPLYMLRSHVGGFDGFLACPNKVDGVAGCSCAMTNAGMMANTARKEFLECLNNPSLIQEHIMFNKRGYLSTAMNMSDAYGGHQYRIDAQLYEFTLAEARARFRIAGAGVRPMRPVWNNYTVYIDTVNIGQARLLGLAARGGVELTFLTAVPMQYLTYAGVV